MLFVLIQWDIERIRYRFEVLQVNSAGLGSGRHPSRDDNVTEVNLGVPEWIYIYTGSGEPDGDIR